MPLNNPAGTVVKPESLKVLTNEKAPADVIPLNNPAGPVVKLLQVLNVC